MNKIGAISRFRSSLQKPSALGQPNQLDQKSKQCIFLEHTRSSVSVPIANKSSPQYGLCRLSNSKISSPFMLQNRTSSSKSNNHEEETELILLKTRDILAKEFPSYYNNGVFVSRISYVEFIDTALERIDELGIADRIETYKELLKIFPPGLFCPDKFTFGPVHLAQQNAAVRVLCKMVDNKIRPDKEIERIVIAAFSKKSDVWNKVARTNYWSMKGSNVDPNPLPPIKELKTDELAKLALERMTDDPKAKAYIERTIHLPDAIDNTWIAYSQSPSQISILNKLNEKSILYIEEAGLTYVGKNSLSYFVLKYKLDEKTLEEKLKKPEPNWDMNVIKFKFYGKTIREKLKEPEERYFVDDSYILATAITGTSSHDSVLSWLKTMQKKTPHLAKLNVVFKFSRPIPEIMDPNADPEAGTGDKSTSRENKT